MKDKLWSVAVVAALVGVWVGAFLVFRGSDAPVETASAEAGPTPTTSPSSSPSQSAGAPASPLPSGPDETGGAVDGDLRGSASLAEKRAQKLRDAAATPATATADLRVATFNVLGNSHTAGDGPRYAKFASGPARVPGMVRILEGQGVDVAGLQEFQPVQRAAFARVARGWSAYPGGSSFSVGTTSVVWRTDRFDLVDARLTPMPFYDQVRPAPSVLLRDKTSGLEVWVTSVHQPADTDRFPRQQGAREQATARQVALVRELTATGTPAIVTGDMNEKESFFCRFTRGSGFTSPAGGSTSGGCRAPAPRSIDWILGSPSVTWTSFTVDRSALVRRTTDHAVQVAGVRVSGTPAATPSP